MNNSRVIAMIKAPLVLALVLLPAAALAAGPQVVGWVEQVTLYPGAVTLKAKIDSGAETTSLDVEHVVHFRRNGSPWVRFELSVGIGRRVVLERPEVRSVQIKRHGSPSQPRPVVMLELCLDSVLKQTEVNLTDRAGFIYPLLVGRRFLQGDFLIDPGHTFTSKPACRQKP